MDTKYLNKIFLSASIPSIDRDYSFYKTADIIAIRDAVRALAAVVIPNAQLVWGGHPSITPLIRNVMAKMNSNLNDHVTIYQSLYFESKFPEENKDFENVIKIKAVENNRLDSIQKMRNEMIRNNNFKAAIFIGGMEGVIDEYELFSQVHPKAKLLPVASTGAGSRRIFEKKQNYYDQRLLKDFAYMALFRDLLSELIS
jgi:hypothetical protein